MQSARPEVPPRKLLIATGNLGKFSEYTDLLGDLPLQLTSLRDEGISQEVEETGATYEENARLKAEAYAKASGLLTLADDSGLEVEALGGVPGPFSARYGGPGLRDAERVQLLLRDLADVPSPRRSARFVCAIAIAAPNTPTQLMQGECSGTIALEPLGNNGFGYDPVFLFPELGKTLAELQSAQKNAMSHRGNAARKAKALLLQLLKEGKES